MTDTELKNIQARLETLRQLASCDQVGGTILDGKTPLISVLPSDKYNMNYLTYAIILVPYDIKALLNEVERLTAENTELKRYKKRLEIDPGGSDKIDELEQALQFIRHRCECLTAENERLRASGGE